ncbi:MAG: M48 family metallopeptidase [Paracoccaceae bacterium]|nr:MAG: M48 family metallopeptidase [Paracoccaceae bacterium]
MPFRLPFPTVGLPHRLHLPGPPPVEVILRASARARRLSLRVSRGDGRVTLTVPHRVRAAEAEAFLATQEGWLRRTLAAIPGVIALAPGGRVPVEGRDLVLTPATGRSVRIEGDRLLVPGPAEMAPRRAATFLRALARDRLAAACDRHAATLGRRFATLVLSDPRSRWGSCSAQGRLMFSWRLILAPPPVLDYVAAHEVAHLAHMDHSPAFWAAVARLCPDYAAHRAWLRGEGHALHALRF